MGSPARDVARANADASPAEPANSTGADGRSQRRPAATSRSRSASVVASQSSSEGPSAPPPLIAAASASRRRPDRMSGKGQACRGSRQSLPRTSATRLVATGLSGSRPTSVSASGTPCTDRRPSSTVRPVAGKAGVTTTSRAPRRLRRRADLSARVPAQRRVDLHVPDPAAGGVRGGDGARDHGLRVWRGHPARVQVHRHQVRPRRPGDVAARRHERRHPEAREGRGAVQRARQVVGQE